MFLENMLKVKYTIYKVKYTIGTNIALRQKQTHQKNIEQNRKSRNKSTWLQSHDFFWQMRQKDAPEKRQFLTNDAWETSYLHVGE